MRLSVGPRPGAEIPQWIELAQAGSREAFGHLMEECRPYLLWLANRELPAEVQAKGGASDLVQDTLLRAQQGFHQFQGRTEAELLAWLRRVLLNHAANVQRWHEAEKRDVGREQPLDNDSSLSPTVDRLAADMPSPSSCLIQDEQEQRLMAALARLPEDYRQVIHLRYWERKSFEEIGLQLQRSSEAARKLWGRAIQRLQEELTS